MKKKSDPTKAFFSYKLFHYKLFLKCKASRTEKNLNNCDIKSVTVRYSKTVSNLVQPEIQLKIIIQEQETVEKPTFLT